MVAVVYKFLFDRKAPKTLNVKAPKSISHYNWFARYNTNHHK